MRGWPPFCRRPPASAPRGGATFGIGSLTAQSLDGPFGAFEETWSYLAILESRVPFFRLLHATRPCLIQLLSEVAGLATVVHFPEVGRLEGALVPQRLQGFTALV